MKNKLFTLAILSLGGFLANAQVGINTSNASAMLDVVSKGNTAATKALEINNSSATEMLTVLNNGNVGININNPATKLHIVSSTAGSGFQLVDGSQGANKILTSDANGAATWQTPAASGITSITGTSPITASTTSGVTTIGINRNDLGEGASASNATDAFVLTGGLAGSVVGGSNISLTVNNTAPLWNANQLQGTAIANTTPTSSQVLTFNGTSWAPATPTPQTLDWHIGGNTDIVATNVSSSVGSSASTSLKYLGTQNANDLVFVANGTIRGVIDNTNGTLTGGGTDGDSYFMWGSQNSATKGGVNFTFNNAIIAGFKNTLINSNGITATGKTAAVILGRENSVTYNGVAIGYNNKANGAVTMGYSNDAASGFTIGTNNKFGSGSYMVFGRDFNAIAAGNPNSSLPANSNVYASEFHSFQSQDGTAPTTVKFAKIGVNTLPLATQVADIKVSKAVQFVSDASLACDDKSEGSIRYNSNGTTGNFQGCRIVSGSYNWVTLN